MSVIDRSGNELSFRDICGADLEYLDHVFRYDPDEPGSKEIMLDQEQALGILSHLKVRPARYDLGRLTNKVIDEVFAAVRNEILINYVPKLTWLKYCYGIQDGSFANLKAMEEVPMSKFSAMVEIHSKALEELKPTPKNDSGQ